MKIERRKQNRVKSDLIIGKSPSEEDEFYIAWGRETLKNGISLQNDIFKQSLTLNTALISISVFYEKLFKGSELLFCLFILSFLISLILSLLGILPTATDVDLDSPSEIKNHKERIFYKKQILIKCSFLFIIIGFTVVFIRAFMLFYISM